MVQPREAFDIVLDEKEESAKCPLASIFVLAYLTKKPAAAIDTVDRKDPCIVKKMPFKYKTLSPRLLEVIDRQPKKMLFLTRDSEENLI